jgi:asparagine synthase (glutamine-hydrolysing)
MMNAISYRGPDDEGFYEDANISLGARRLSIIDLAGGHQPMTNEEGSVWTVFNGEIYNFKSLRKRLGSVGHRFATSSDTEVIVHAYEEFGLEFTKQLSGMFAIALWDEAERRLILARDRVGMKPLYYVPLSNGVVFASEIKALLFHPQVVRSPDMDVLRLIVAFGYSPDERTPFRGILKIPPGCMMVRQGEQSRIVRYWDLAFPSTFETDELKVIGTLKRTLRAAVASHLVSDVPVGVMLSGGLDSSIIAVLAKEVVGDRLLTFTFSYGEEPEAADRHYSKEMVNFLGTEHREIVVSADDLVRFLPAMVYHHDEPKVDAASIPTMATALRIKRDATVVLVGEGSDEQLGGYFSHLYYARTRTYRAVVPGLRSSTAFTAFADSSDRLRNWRRVLEYFGALKNKNLALRIMNSPVFTDWDFSRSADAAFMTKSAGGDPGRVYDLIFRDVQNREELFPVSVDMRVYIPNDICMKIDKMTMAGSVEARMPFLDAEVLDFSPKISPNLKTKMGVSKYLLRKAFVAELPHSISARPKQTIRVPMPMWITTNFDVFDQLAENGVNAKRSPVSRDALRRIALRAHGGNDPEAARQLMALAVIEEWYCMYLDPDAWRGGIPASVAL